MEKTIDFVLSSEESEACSQLFSLTTSYLSDASSVFKHVEDTVTAEKLLQFFTAKDNARKMRRWAGILLEALISQCLPIRDHMMSLEEWLPKLGELTIQGDEDLKLVAATIIRALARSPRSLPLFWPNDILESQHVQRFPLGNSQSSWVEKLFQFQDDAHSLMMPATSSTSAPGLYFVEHLTIDNRPISRAGGSVYLIIRNGVTITLTPPDRTKIFYLDIPLDVIKSFDMHESHIPAHTEPSQRSGPRLQSDILVTQLTLRLETPQGASSCLVNTNPENIKQVTLTSDDAERIRGALSALKNDLDAALGNLSMAGGGQSIESKGGSTYRIGGSQTIEINSGIDDKEEQPVLSLVAQPVVSERPKTARKAQTVGKLATLVRALSSTSTVPIRSIPKATAQVSSNPEVTQGAIMPVHQIYESTNSAFDHLRVADDRKERDELKAQAQQKRRRQKENIDVYEFVASDDDEIFGNESKAQSKGQKKRKETPKARYPKSRKTAPKATAKKIKPIARRPRKQVRIEEESEDGCKDKQKQCMLPTKPTRTRAQVKAVKGLRPSQQTELVSKKTQSTTESAKNTMVVPTEIQRSHGKQGQQPHTSIKPMTRKSRVVQDSERYTDIDIESDILNNEKAVSKRLGRKEKENEEQASTLTNELPKEKAGSSQAAAIAISSDKEDSDSSEEELDLIETYCESLASSPPKLIAEKQAKLFATPLPRPRLATSTYLIDDNSTRKMSIVSFDRTGPRNQGFMPGTYQSSVAHQSAVEPVFHKEKVLKSQAGKTKYETQPTQVWFHKVQVLSDTIDEEIGIPDEPIPPSCKRRKLSTESQLDQDWPDIDDVLQKPSTAKPQPLEAAGRLQPRKVQETLDSSAAKKNGSTRESMMSKTLKFPVSQRRVDHVVLKDATATSDRVLRRNASQPSQRSVRVSKDGSPIPKDLGNKFQANQNGNTTQMEVGDIDTLSRTLLPSRHHHRSLFSVHESRNVSIISSNRKVVPRSPEAESQAISGRAPEQEVHEALARSQCKERSNPFDTNRKYCIEESTLMQKLRQIADSKANAIADAERIMVEDGPMGDSTSNSSFEDCEEAMKAKEVESAWEAATQPRHRRLVDVLGRVARRLVSHLIDSETAVSDIIEDYNVDAEFLIHELEKAHQVKCEQLLEEFHASAQKMADKYRVAHKKISSEQKVMTTPVVEGLAYWAKEQETQKKQVLELELIAQEV